MKILEELAVAEPFGGLVLASAALLIGAAQRVTWLLSEFLVELQRNPQASPAATLRLEASQLAFSFLLG
jgi:hypothetical protein